MEVSRSRRISLLNQMMRGVELYSCGPGILDVKFMSIQKMSMEATLYCHYD
jgi:hypothetical protein